MPPRSLRRKPPARNRKRIARHDAYRPKKHDHEEAQPVPTEWVLPRILTPEEKRELIHAHASARKSKEQAQVWGIGYYIAIAFSCLVILSGWMLTFDKNIRQNIVEPDMESSFVDQLKSQTNQLQNDFSTGKNQINQLIQERQQREALNKSLEEQLRNANTTSVR